MSFAKAKRFLEKIPVGPSPTEYNINSASKLPGAVILKSERFAEPRSPSGSENGGSTKSVPCFRTPTLPKKKKLLLQSPATQVKSNELFKTELEIEALKDKIVECQNKDHFINDLNEQIEELKQNINLLRNETDILNTNIVQLQISNVQLEENHQNAIVKLEDDHNKEAQELQEEIIFARDQITSINEQYARIKAEKKLELEKLLDNMDSFQVLYKNMSDACNKEIEVKEETLQCKENELLRLEQELINLQRNHADEVQRITEAQRLEVQDIEYEMLKTMTDMQQNLDKEKQIYEQKLFELEAESERQVEEYKQEFEAEKLRILNETEAKIQYMEENSKETIVLAEIQMQEKIKDIEMTWTLKLDDQKQEAQAILKECEEISVYNIIQCEIEKNKAIEDFTIKSGEALTLTSQMKSLEHKIGECDQNYKRLVTDIDLIKNENEQIKKDLDAETSKLEIETKQAAIDKKAYGITIRKSHDAIEVLKKRLMNSDQDVVQLKSELEACEIEKLDLEDQCCKLREEAEVTKSFNEDYVVEVEDRIKLVEDSLVGKLENYKVIVNESINAYMAKIEQQEELLISLREQLQKQEQINCVSLQLNDKYQEENTQLEEQNKDVTQQFEKIELSNKKLLEAVDRLVEENEDLKNALSEQDEVEILRKQLTHLNDKSDTYFRYLEYYKTKTAEYEEELLDVAVIRKKYIEKSGSYDKLLQKHDALLNKITEQNALIDPFRKQLEEYKQENSELLNQVGETEIQARDLALKCAQLLGHQNHKQKIQHIVDLKNKNDELQQGLKEFKQKDKAQGKLIEKLREELEAIKKSRKNKLTKTDKENISSPNRTLNNSRGLSGIEGSPGPLRERN